MRDVRVLDLTDGVAGVTGRVLAEMGADVLLVEPVVGVASRQHPPFYEGQSLRFASIHGSKRGLVIDLDDPVGRERLLGLTDEADLVIESRPVGDLDRLGIGHEVMRERNPRLVVMSLTNFGQTGPYRNYRGSDAVLIAMSSALTRSGAPDREPLLPPGELASQTAATHAAFVALLALYRARSTGSGDYADCSLFDLVVQDLDPAFGMGGTATMGQPMTQLPPGRPDRRMMYPILPCADGHVRMFIASAKQWRAVFTWLGEPEALADPSFDQLVTRFFQWDKIRPALVELFADLTRDDIVSYAIDQGVAVAPLNTSGEVLQSAHVRERKSFVVAEVAPGVTGNAFNGYVDFDGVRAGFAHRAPRLGEHDHAGWLPRRAATVQPSNSTRRPLEGVRVLDLGVIVVGAETGRSLADQGAEVIKIESRQFMDGARQSDQSDRCGYSFVLGNRGKKSLGMNLRSDEGKEVFRRLVAESDVVLTNFKPGTLESLGLGWDDLRAVNPRVILVESSALGSFGGWSQRMGYGPLVRATVGLTELWRHPDSADAFGDDMTVYPDHAAGRVGVMAVLAALLERQRTGLGTRIGLAQMETVFGHLAMEFLWESLQPGSLVARGNGGAFDAPCGVYRCAGDDAYVVVTTDGDRSFAELARTIGKPEFVGDPRFLTAEGRVQHGAYLDEALHAWTAQRAPVDAQDLLQAAGVAAGAAVHAFDLLANPQLQARGQFGRLHQPGFDEPLDSEGGPAIFTRIPPPELRPAPLMAADTETVCRSVLGLTDAEIATLVDDGVLEVRERTAATSA